MNFYSLFPLIGAISVLFLVIFVFFKNQAEKSILSFLIFCSSVIIWMIGYAVAYSLKDEKVAVLFCRISCTAAMFTAPAFYHFIIDFLRLKKEKKWVIVSYLVMFFITPLSMSSPYFLSGVYKYYWGFYSKAGLLHPLYLLISSVILFRGFYLLYFHYHLYARYKEGGALDFIETTRIKYVFIACILLLLAAVDYIPKYGVEFYPFGFIFAVLFAVIITYSIVAHHLMGIKVVMQKATRIIFSFLIAIGIYFAFFYFGFNIIGWSPWQSTIFAILPCLCCFIYLIWRMQQIIFKKEEDSQLALIRIAREMVKIKIPLKLIEKVADSVYDIIKVRQVSIFLLNDKTKEYVLQAGKGRLPFLKTGFVLKKKDPVINWFKKTGKEFYQQGLIKKEEKHFLQLDIVREWLHSEKLLAEKGKNWIESLIKIQFQMESLRASLIIPSCYGKKIVGILCLGGNQYTQRDIEVLSGFTDDMAMNISNAFLISDLRHQIDEKTMLSRERYNAYQRLETIFKEIISAFAMTVSKMDPDYTYEHVEKTSKYAQKLVDKLQPKQIKEKLISRDMFFAGILLHDIGKIFIPKNILNKPGSLNDEEWKIIKRHPVDGFELLKNIKGMEISAEIIKHHHERIDGKGYPDGLKGDQISIGAKIVCVVDSFEAMTADRPYRKAKPRKEAITQLVENSGTQFDSLVVEAFVELCEKGEI